MSDHHPLVSDVVDSTMIAQPLLSFELRDALDTGPPLDLVVGLHRLVI